MANTPAPAPMPILAPLDSAGGDWLGAGSGVGGTVVLSVLVPLALVVAVVPTEAVEGDSRGWLGNLVFVDSDVDETVVSLALAPAVVLEEVVKVDDACDSRMMKGSLV